MPTFLRLAAFVALLASTGPARGDDAPNILWITAEDMSPTLGCYGDTYATTPNIDQLASESVRYTHAFATAPVCSPSRSCLITGCYAPSLGTQQMRSAFPIPDFMSGFPAILRKELGYYASNNVKTDYNTGDWERVVAASWNESSAEAHWRNRSADEAEQPFFSVFNLMTSHQSRSMVWPYEQFKSDVQSRLSAGDIHDPATAPLPPYYVDTEIVRRDWARYYDCVTAMDLEVGKILYQLDADELADDTIVFFFSDHGSGMPRHKRALFDSGLHVPLLIRFPEKWRHLAPASPGETVDRLVSFVDFAPTVLSLAGAKIPDYMQGSAFLGLAEGEPRDYVHGHRDRVDEVRDLARSVRDQRWLYIRNYMPHLGYNQPTSWPDQGDIRHEFYRLTDQATMTPAQWQFAGPARPVEELYDCEADPQNLNNLASSSEAEHREALNRLRREFQSHRLGSLDLGFIPETEAWRVTHGSTPWEAARSDRPPFDLESLYIAADGVGSINQDLLLGHLASGDPMVRYWGALATQPLPSLSDRGRESLQSALDDDSAAVRIEAATSLARKGGDADALATLIKAIQDDDLSAVLHAIRNLELLIADGVTPPEDTSRIVRELVARCETIRPPDTPPTVVTSGEQDLAMFIAMSAHALLANLDESP